MLFWRPIKTYSYFSILLVIIRPARICSQHYLMIQNPGCILVVYSPSQDYDIVLVAKYLKWQHHYVDN